MLLCLGGFAASVGGLWLLSFRFVVYDFDGLFVAGVMFVFGCCDIFLVCWQFSAV